MICRANIYIVPWKE